MNTLVFKQSSSSFFYHIICISTSYRYTVTTGYEYNVLILGLGIQNSPGNTVRVEEWLNTGGEWNKDTIPHRTVVPLFTDVAGTVRLDCTVPEDDSVATDIPRFWLL